MQKAGKSPFRSAQQTPVGAESCIRLDSRQIAVAMAEKALNVAYESIALSLLLAEHGLQCRHIQLHHREELTSIGRAGAGIKDNALDALRNQIRCDFR